MLARAFFGRWPRFCARLFVEQANRFARDGFQYARTPLYLVVIFPIAMKIVAGGSCQFIDVAASVIVDLVIIAFFSYACQEPALPGSNSKYGIAQR
jgi:hypothetical protein